MLQIVDVHRVVEKTYQRMNLKSKASYLDKGDSAHHCLCMYVPVVDFDNKNIVIALWFLYWLTLGLISTYVLFMIVHSFIQHC